MRTSVFCLVFCFLVANSVFALNKTRDCKCKVTTGKRIIGGRQSNVNYPWHVTILANDHSNQKPDFQKKKLIPDLHRCSGVILNEWYVLTSGNCLVSGIGNQGLLAIGYGSNDLVKSYVDGKYVKDEKLIFHPEWRIMWPDIRNDIGLIKLKTPLNFSDTVQPACLGTGHQDSYEGVLQTIGFGSKIPLVLDVTKAELTKPQFTRYLKEADVYENKDKKSDFCNGLQKDKSICVKTADWRDGAQGTSCVGDEGAPLHVTTNGKSTVVGVFSTYQGIEESRFRARMCEAGSAFTRISGYWDWIRDNVEGEMCD